MAIGDDFSIDRATGDIRYTGTTANYTVIAFHRWLGDLADDDEYTGNDELDITDPTPSERSTDNFITLINGFNIDDIASEHLYDGSIVQDAGNTIYDGVQVFAPANTPLEIIQNGEVASPNFWGTGINADAAQGISHRFMIKVRSGGTDINGRRLLGVTRNFGNSYSEFPVNGTSRGNNVIALSYANDLNNNKTSSTIAGYTTISNQEGYRAIDVNNDTTDEYYYSEWNRDTYTINDLYERTKWLSQEPVTEDSNADTGSDFIVDNGTILGQAQSFAVGGNAKFIMRAYLQLKKVGSPTGNVTVSLYSHTGTYGTSSVPNASLVAADTYDSSLLTTAYKTIEFKFSPSPNPDDYYEMTASTNYCVVIEHAAGTATDYVHVRGLATSGTHGGNRAENTGTWGAAATDDLWFDVQTCSKLYGFPGVIFRGITQQLTMTTPRTGTFSAVEPVSWTGGTGIMLAIDSTTTATAMWIQVLTGTAPGTGVTVTGTNSSATATTTGAATDRGVSQPFIGASTGSALIGSYGLGVEYLDLTAADQLTALDNAQYQPPNNVTFTVFGVVSGEDYVHVTNDDTSNIDYNQLTLNTTLSGGTETQVVVTAAIPGDTPNSGVIRIELDSGKYKKQSYTSWSGSTFTIPSTNYTGDNATAPADVYIGYIDKLAAATSESFTGVYQSDRTLFIRVRDGGVTPIKTFETTGTLGSAGGSTTAIRTSDE